MSENMVALGRQIRSARELRGVVQTMKNVAASGIGLFETAVRSLEAYDRAVGLGLGACFRQEQGEGWNDRVPRKAPSMYGVIVFGSDQGLIGPFNERMADFVVEKVRGIPGNPQVWAIGERVHGHLARSGWAMKGLSELPRTVEEIGPLVGRLQLEDEGLRATGGYDHTYVFHQRPLSGARYEPVMERMLPLDSSWKREQVERSWPSKNIPEVMNGSATTIRFLIHEHLFITLFRACAESLASENASRLAAMERAERNIRDLLEDLRGRFNRLRQSSIDEELFDVISGFEALVGKH